MDNDSYWYWFVNIKGIGNILRNKLLRYFGHPKELYFAGEKELSAFLNQKQKAYFTNSRNTNVIEKSKDRLKQNHICFFHWESENYPERLRHISDPPYGIYLRGRLPRESAPALGMVGSRKATVYGRKTAEWFAKELAGKGIQIISGLAAGIDASSHKGALQANGYTMGILGGGIDTVYPRENFNLYMELYEKGGVMSEYNMGIPNRPGLFPVRNRLISGMSDGILVLEAGEKSGSFITVDQALDQGKEIFALPGRISDVLSTGCNRLIAQGAIPVQSPEDIAECFLERRKFVEKGSVIAKETSVFEKNVSDTKHGKIFHFSKEPVFYTPEQKEIYQYLDEIIPVSFDILLEKSGYNIVQLQHILFEMELYQWIFQPNQNIYLKKYL